jgi:hypothetical protein
MFNFNSSFMSEIFNILLDRDYIDLDGYITNKFDPLI